MTTQGALARNASHRLRALLLVMLAPGLPTTAALAGEVTSGPSRYRVAVQLRPVESRYALTAELRTKSPPERGHDRYTLKQLMSPDASCEAPGDLIFADQFE